MLRIQQIKLAPGQPETLLPQKAAQLLHIAPEQILSWQILRRAVDARDRENINGGLLVGVGPEDFGSSHPLAGIRFQQQLERAAFIVGGSDYSAPAQRVGDFLQRCPSSGPGRVQPSYRPGVRFTSLDLCLPPVIAESLRQALPLLDKKLPGFAHEDAILTAVESRSSSPVRLPRGADGQSPFSGLYPCGEGAGYAGGILSAAADGIRTAEKVLEVYR